MKNLNIGTRLGLGFAGLGLLVAALTVLSISRMADISASLSKISQDRVPKVQRLDSMAADVHLIARELRNALIHEDPRAIGEALDQSRQAQADTEVQLRGLAPGIRTPRGLELLAALKAARDRYAPLQDALLRMLAGGERDAARGLITGEFRVAQQAYIEAVDAMKAFQIGLINTAADEGEADYREARALTLGLLALVLIAAAGGGWAITSSITAPLQHAVRITETVAGGDLSARIVVDRRDETGRLLGALRDMNSSLQRVVTEVREGAEHIATGSQQIAVGNADLSQRTEEQAGSLQQTAASMEQLSGSVQSNAEAARQANALASLTNTAAAESGVLMGRVVSTMQDTLAGSRRIADIISVIDGIAFKTNILALNAAVEAARAGEHGRGFAVVASEVRSLAQHAASAAKDVRGLIDASVTQIENGASLVEAAGAAMDKVVSQIGQVSVLVGQIDAASGEQASGIGQISEAMAQLDQTTQQNAALVEQAAAAAESLDQQVQRLNATVAVFRTEAQG